MTHSALYHDVLTLHGALRWVVILAAASVTAAAANERMLMRRFPFLTRRLSALFVGVIDVQLLLGFVLYFSLSPITQMAFRDRSLLVSRAETGFFGVVHVIAMLLAVAVAHYGNVALKRSAEHARTGRAAVFFALSLALLVSATPWWRPVIR